MERRAVLKLVALTALSQKLQALPNAGMEHMQAAAPSAAPYTLQFFTEDENKMLDELMEMMTRGRFRHVPVVEEDSITGLVSIGDVVKTRISETVQEAQSLREYIAAG